MFDAAGNKIMLLLWVAVALASTRLQGVICQSDSAVAEELQRNSSRVLQELLDNYDKRLRPNFGGEALNVDVSMFVYSMGPIVEANMEYTIDMYFRMQWHDSRLTYTGVPYLALNADVLSSFWIPDIYFINEKSAKYHNILYKNSLLRINPNGDLLFSTRLTMTASCSMDLSDFPFDKQRCSLDMESYAYSTEDIFFRWIPEGEIYIDPHISLPQFTVLGSNSRSRLGQYYVGNYSIITADFFLGREISYYVIQTYIPSWIIVCVSWLSFWINRSAVPARVALGITTVLTMTTLVGNAGNSLPKLSYIKAIDVFLGTCYFFVFGALLEYVLVIYYDQPRYQKARDLNEEFLKQERDARKERSAHTNGVVVSVDDEAPGSARSRSPASASRPPTSQRMARNPSAATNDNYGIIEGKVSKEEEQECLEATLCSFTNSCREKMCVFGINPYTIDKISRVGFPVVFFSFNLFYWIFYAIIKDASIADLMARGT